MKIKTLILAIATLCLLPLLIGCAFQRSGPNLSSPAYHSASPENKDRIAQGNIGIGMTIDECRAAWPDTPFQHVSAYQTGENRYETWRVENYSRQARSMMWLYLHLKNGQIIDVSEVRKR